MIDVAKVFLLDLDKIKVASFNDVPFNEVNWADDGQNDTEEQVDKIYKVSSAYISICDYYFLCITLSKSIQNMIKVK